jgi:hypothetical protein
MRAWQNPGLLSPGTVFSLLATKTLIEPNSRITLVKKSLDKLAKIDSINQRLISSNYWAYLTAIFVLIFSGIPLRRKQYGQRFA